MSFSFNSQICHDKKEYKIQIITDSYEQFLYMQEKVRECVDKKHKECEHEWELMSICCDNFYTIHNYKCSKCGAKTTKSMGI
jgi:hypothetical protein